MDHERFIRLWSTEPPASKSPSAQARPPLHSTDSPAFVHGSESEERQFGDALLQENGFDGDLIGAQALAEVIDESRRMQHVQYAHSVASRPDACREGG